MAGVLVGGAFLSSFLNVVFDKLASPQVANFIRGKKIDPKLLERMKTTLTVVRAVLDDAEKKQIKDPNVNNWLNDLKDAVYVADDLLDEISTKAATQKEVTNPFSRFFNVHDREMATKLEDIVERLESILKLKESLNLKEISVDNLSYKNLSTSLSDGKHVYGRDEDKEAIMKLLLDDSNDCDEVYVISIVGMGGVGKTTLAQLVYNEDGENSKFDFKAWACVSEEFDIMRVTKIITQAVTRGSCDLDDLNLLHLDLQGKLKDKKFLIVLDDVWIEDYVNWDLLMRPFQRGVRGSKILVTTRSEKVASVVQSAQTYNLKKLSSDDCWLVFANHACFLPGSSANSMVLESIGREIVEKCKGLPLAAQSLGSILRRKHDVKDWDNLLKSDIWELSEHESKIIPSLRVSYHYLPPNLKRCFVYCSLFSKDYEFQKNDLILLWMAEDLLSSPSKGKTLEEVGYEYFDDLVARSFLQRSNNSEWESFVMHDLLHDLATFLGGEFYIRSEQLGEESKISSKTRHLACTISSGLLENTNIFETVKFLRTFFPSGVLNNETCILLLMSKLKQLRVFSLSSIWVLGFDALPDSIGELIHLRYLDLSRTRIKKLPQSLCNLYNLQTLKLYHCKNLTVLPNGMENLTNLLYLDISNTSITELPESICELYNLQTLKLSDCKRLTMLPTQMQNLVNLRHLDIDGTPLKEMPKRMGKLTRLQNLATYIVGKHEENGIQELGGLSNLQGLLLIQNLENVSNGSQALEAKIMDKKNMNKLKLFWSPVDCCADSQTEKDILCNLQPHQDLQHLEIIGYKGTGFPDWVGSSSYQNMTELILSSCKNCWMLPSLGQLSSLKTLMISNMDALVTIDSSFYKNTTDSSMLTPFPSLKSLEFHDMPCWEVWSPIESYAFPKLKNLFIAYCPKLRSDLPTDLPVLEILNIVQSQFSLTSFVSENFSHLKSLTLHESQNLESLSVSPNCFLPKLQSLWIFLCPNFISFPEEEFHAPIMTSFEVSYCGKLKSLPQQMHTLLPKLEKLYISNCPDIESFPEGGIPPSLRSIFIINCEKLLNSPAWPSMDMLTKVIFGGPCDGIKSFPKEGFLPSSLTSLTIDGFSSLETLDCKGLLHLTSLQQLVIINCAKLEKIAGEKLPVSLIELFIDKCPLLEEQCSLKDPQVWPKISHVRLFGPRFDGRFRWL